MEVKSYQPVGPTYCTFNLIVNSVQCPPSGEVSTTTRASHSDILGIILVMEIELKYKVEQLSLTQIERCPTQLHCCLIRGPDTTTVDISSVLIHSLLLVNLSRNNPNRYIGDIRGNISVSQRGDTSLVTARTWGSCHVTLHLVV